MKWESTVSPMTKQERFQEFLRRLQDAPAASSHEEAFILLSVTLNAVEDELSEIPYQPELWQTDGRMYPPQDDNARDVDGRSDLVRYRSKAHNTFVRTNGAFAILDRFNNTLFEKPGFDGVGIDL